MPYHNQRLTTTTTTTMAGQGARVHKTLSGVGAISQHPAVICLVFWSNGRMANNINHQKQNTSANTILV
jgi:uncharacterized membrane protein